VLASWAALRIRQIDPKAVVILADGDPGAHRFRLRRETIQVGDGRIRRRGIRLNRPADTLAVADGIAGYRHQSRWRASGRRARRRRVTGTAQWEWTHQQLVRYATGSEVDAKFAVAARSDDVCQRHDVGILV
jgi:hypothetical protein